MRTLQHGLTLRNLVLTINGLLLVQYLLGITVNLFATLPFDRIDPAAGSFLQRTGAGFAFAREAAFLPLQLHWLDASLLILASLVLLVGGVRARRRLIWALALTLFLIFSVATLSGAAFIGYAGNNVYSLSMATAFIVATAVSVFLLVQVLRDPTARDLGGGIPSTDRRWTQPQHQGVTRVRGS
jgi:hypothetical protein